MVELLNWAFEKGGILGVVALGLAVAVVYLYRKRERDAREHRREQRRNLKFLLQLFSELRNGNHRAELPSRPYTPAADEPHPESEEFLEWSEPTVVTQRKRDTAEAQIRHLVSEYLKNGHAPDSE